VNCRASPAQTIGASRRHRQARPRPPLTNDRRLASNGRVRGVVCQGPTACATRTPRNSAPKASTSPSSPSNSATRPSPPPQSTWTTSRPERSSKPCEIETGRASKSTARTSNHDAPLLPCCFARSVHRLRAIGHLYIAGDESQEWCDLRVASFAARCDMSKHLARTCQSIVNAMYFV